jgi:U3 small nucleolar RNA-associated protein 10
VTSYSSYILELAAELLTTAEPTTSEGRQLLISILTALEESFTHDQDDFWQSPSHFTPIASPLVALLSQINSPPLTESLITAITALASATSSAEEHRELNTAMLKLMRSDDAATRVNAVQVERRLTEKLGEEWLVMVPEMLPFVAELLEDDDENVERESRAWVRRIEEVLGESLEF